MGSTPTLQAVFRRRGRCACGRRELLFRLHRPRRLRCPCRPCGTAVRCPAPAR